jgi:hypothetical protein
VANLDEKAISEDAILRATLGGGPKSLEMQ